MPVETAPAKPADAPIYGYDYESRHYCSGCIEGALGENTYSTLHTPEQALDLIADDWNINRNNEGSYSYFAFPKVLRARHGATCSDCGGALDKDLRTTPAALCGANHTLGEDCRPAASTPENAHTIDAGATR